MAGVSAASRKAPARGARMTVTDLGRCDYAIALARQNELVESVLASPKETAYLLLVEHDPPVITLGRGADVRDVIASAAELARRGVRVHRVSRGGQVTYHGPGQLVAYPIFRLDLHGRDLHAYLRRLEQAVIDVLAELGIAGNRVGGRSGVWVGRAKIAALGVALRRWTTCHGLSLNVGADLSGFEMIVPCGIRDAGVTSVSRVLGRQVALEPLKRPLSVCLCRVLGFEPEGLP